MAYLHFRKKRRGSERKVTCLKPSIGRNGTRTYFVLGYFQYIRFTGCFHFSSLRYPHGPSSSSCRAVLDVTFLVRPFLAAHLNSHPPFPQHSHIPIPTLGFVFPLWLYQHLTCDYIILVHHLPSPAECKLQESKDFKLFCFLQNPLHLEQCLAFGRITVNIC